MDHDNFELPTPDFTCATCCDTGYFYAPDGIEAACDCEHGEEWAAEQGREFYREPVDSYDDEDAFTSAGWGTDESYGDWDHMQEEW
jgi:hypothetical protein